MFNIMEHLRAFARGDHPLAVIYRQHAGFVKFLAVGSFNTVLDISLYFFFSSIWGLNLILANVLSTGITLCFSFFLNHRFVFRSDRRKRTIAVQFVLITLFNAWVVQSIIITGVVYALGNTAFFLAHIWTLNLLAKICSVSVSFMLNFLGYRFIFKTKGAS